MSCASDPKLKTAITPYISDTAKVASVAPIKYKWNAVSGYDTARTNAGFDAVQIAAVYPECVIARDDVTYVQDPPKDKGGLSTTREVKTGTQTLSIDQGCLIAVLWNAQKDSQAKLTNICKNNPKLCEATP
jgi:hypothetical protein